MAGLYMLNTYLSKLGLTEKEVAIYTALNVLGIQPASVIAKHCKLDRVTTYKNLKKLNNRGFVKMYSRGNVQCFGVGEITALHSMLQEKLESTRELLNEFDTVSQILKSLQSTIQLVPQIQIFEGETGIKNFFRDILFEIQDGNLKQVRMFTSNTFEERLGEIPLSKFIKEFFREIKKSRVDLEIFEAVGGFIPECVRKVSFTEFDPEKRPAARGTTNIFLVGSVVFIACYKTSQIGLKIKQSEISQIFHFLFDVMRGNVRDTYQIP